MRTITSAVTMFAVLAGALSGSVASETTTYSYDAAGRLVTATYKSGGTDAAVHYAYDANGNRTNLLTIAADDRSVDTDGDTFADLDELRYFGGLGQTPAGDADGDGLTTGDELALGSHPGLSDTDGDGADDRHEWVADTDPNNATSRFTIVSLSVSNAPPAVHVTFPSSANRLYTLRVRTNLTAGTWSNVPDRSDIPGSGGMDVLSDTNAPGERFYNVEVKQP